VTPLFVYGTLMRGESAHARLRGARFVAAVRTAPSFGLVDAGGYPGLVRGRTSVAGEIFLVHAGLLEALDAYEDVDLGIYARARIVVSGRRVETYVLLRSPDPSRPMPPVRSGDWRIR